MVILCQVHNNPLSRMLYYVRQDWTRAAHFSDRQQVKTWQTFETRRCVGREVFQPGAGRASKSRKKFEQIRVAFVCI
jgi:hypothetical protein